MAGLFRVLVDFAARTAGFETGVRRMETKTRQFSDNTKKAFRAVGVAIVAMGYALNRAVQGAIERGDQFAKMGQSAGLAARDLSRLSFAAEQAGLTFEQFTTGLIRLNKNMGEAVRGTMESKEAFDALGISLLDSSGKMRQPVDVLAELAAKFSSFDDGASKTTLAMRLFGKAGATMIPFLNEGAAGIEELAKQADALGLTMTNEAARASEVFNDQMSLLKRTATGFANTLTAELLPSLISLANPLEQSALKTTALDDAARSLATGLKLLATAGLITGSVFGTVGRGIGAAAAAISQAAQGHFSQAFNILNDDAASGIERLKETLSYIDGIWNKVISDSLVAAPARAAGIVAPLLLAPERAKASLEDLERYANQAVQKSNDLIRATAPVGVLNTQENELALNAYFENVRNQSLEMKDTFKEAHTEMSEYAKEAARNIQDAFADFLFDPFDKGLKGMLKGFIDIMRRMLANQLASQILGGSFGTWFTGLFGGKRAAGGPVAGGMPYMVGEKGPELFVPGSSGSIVPNNKLGGMTLAPVYNIDARGATTDLVRALPGILQENNRRLMEAWNDRRLRGAFST